MSIEARGITKTFGTFTALQDVSLHVPTGELVALLGPSGSGKTTLLRIIAGLEIPDAGAVLFDGEDATGRNVRDRRVGFVFQHYALFRHMTVFDNVAFGLRVRPRPVRPSRQGIRDRVMDLLKLVQLDWLSDRYPTQLSGGQRQRVALARALAVEPRVLLLDEPFGALDARVRQELRRWLRRLHDDLHITGVFVTHDQEEALEVADRVVVMNHGRAVQVGTPEEVYHHPASPFVYHFLGKVNLFHGRVEDGQVFVGEIAMGLPGDAAPDAAEAKVYVRPHHFDIDRKPNGRGHFRARVVHINPAGPQVKVEVLTEWGEMAHVDLPEERYRTLGLGKGDEVYVSLKEERVFIET
ncbi:MAG: sulfate ABC transporter ATP-binding protein [Acidobacteria bacterium]|nr:sulfate ABC transporter ATP-binding protein [Acidobacteriota bacterium]